MRYAITLERGRDGSYLAWVDELPGCSARGTSREQVEAELPTAIRGFLRWAGEREPSEVELGPVQDVESAIEAEEDTEVLVAVDREPLADDHWQRIESWLGRSRRDLLRVLNALDSEALEETRGGSERTVREELEHVAFVELMYAAWTFDRSSREGLAEFLGWTRRAALERMRVLSEARSSALTWAEWSGAPRPEPWTPRKAARRLIWHELLHLRGIERMGEAAERAT